MFIWLKPPKQCPSLFKATAPQLWGHLNNQIFSLLHSRKMYKTGCFDIWFLCQETFVCVCVCVVCTELHTANKLSDSRDSLPKHPLSLCVCVCGGGTRRSIVMCLLTWCIIRRAATVAFPAAQWAVNAEMLSPTLHGFI